MGLDHETAKQAFSQFISGTSVSANQIEFINLIVDYLTENGVMEPVRLYESPFTDIHSQGPVGVFSVEKADQLQDVLREIRQSAVV